MSAIQGIKKKIVSVKSSSKITKVMQLISTSKLQKAKIALLNTDLHLNIISSFFSRIKNSEYRGIFGNSHGIGSDLVITFSSNRGLCGGLNSGLYRYFYTFFSNQNPDIIIFNIGAKHKSTFAARLKNIKQHNKNDIYHGNSISADKIELMCEEIIKMYNDKQIKSAYLVFNKFISVSRSDQVVLNISSLVTEKSSVVDYVPDSSELDCDQDEMLIKTERMLLFSAIYNALSHNITSEHAFRMKAMEAATTNAKKIIDSLTITYNKMRQAEITKNLIDVISGSQAISK